MKFVADFRGRGDNEFSHGCRGPKRRRTGLVGRLAFERDEVGRE